jgi:tetratricopeptide (TPR) repeat protein
MRASKLTFALVFVLLLGAAFNLATFLEPRASEWGRGARSESALNVLLGDGRRLFANYFYEKADVYFHSGFYPSMFERAQTAKTGDHDHLKGEKPGHEAGEEEHEKQMSFFGPPRDWIEALGRNFMVTKHTHLAGGNEREILPWLTLSSELDPQNIDNYVVAAYWLRRLGKFHEAEVFLRKGLAANPGSYELLFELGRIAYENDHEVDRARNLWIAAIRHWRQTESGKKEPDRFALEEITINLAKLEEEQGNWRQAISYLQQTKEVSPHPEDLEKQINELLQKHSSSKTP